MSIAEDFRKKLIEDAKRRAEGIIRSAEEEAKRIIEEAEGQRKITVEREKQRIVEEARKKSELMLSEARRKARLVVSKAKLELIEDIISRAYRTLGSREGFDLRRSLENLFYESLNYARSPERVIVNPRDKIVMEEILRRGGFMDVKVEVSEEIDGGLVMVSKEGEIIDNTYRTRLERVKEFMAPVIAKKLWSKL